MESDDKQFDMLAASLRAGSSDLTSFVEVLAAKLEGALPDHTRVERKGGHFGRARTVHRILVEIGTERFELQASGARLETTRGTTVRGIVLKTQRIDLDDWLTDLSHHLADEAQRSERAQLALQRLLEA